MFAQVCRCQHLGKRPWNTAKTVPESARLHENSHQIDPFLIKSSSLHRLPEDKVGDEILGEWGKCVSLHINKFSSHIRKPHDDMLPCQLRGLIYVCKFVTTVKTFGARAQIAPRAEDLKLTEIAVERVAQ